MRRLGIALLATTVAAVGCNLTINVPKRPTEPTETAPSGTVPTGPVDDRNTHYRADQSVLRNTKRAGERGAQLVDFGSLKDIIFALKLFNSKMPTAEEIKADLKANPDGHKLLKKITDGVIILTNTKDEYSLVAYEIDADKAGGIVIVGNEVKQASADEVRQLLGKK
jgi:hypothetical protein